MDDNEGLFLKWVNAFLEWFFTYLKPILLVMLAAYLILFAVSYFKGRGVSDDERRTKAFDAFLEEQDYDVGDVIEYMNHEYSEGYIDSDDIYNIFGGESYMMDWLQYNYEDIILAMSEDDFVDRYWLGDVLNWYSEDRYAEGIIAEWVTEHYDLNEIEEWYSKEE